METDLINNLPYSSFLCYNGGNTESEDKFIKNFCFVIMPFGDLFDEIYQKIYIPAIREVGLEPLRADDIYDNRSIIKDIKQSIQDATLILAEVTNRNPNVNYELGIAHALGKEVIIITSNKKMSPLITAICAICLIIAAGLDGIES